MFLKVHWWEQFAQRFQRMLPDAWRSDRSIVQRVMWLHLIWAMTISLLAISVLWWTLNQMVYDNLRNQAVQWITELDTAGTPLYVSSGKKYFEQIEKRVRNFPEIAALRYYDVSGERILGEYRSVDEAQLAPLLPEQIAELTKHASEERPYMVVDAGTELPLVRLIAPVRVRSIRSDGLFNFALDKAPVERVKVIGFIDLAMNPGHYRSQIMYQILLGSALIAILVALSHFLGRWMVRRALEPLTRLQRPLLRLAAGDTDVHVESTGHSEIVTISNALNKTIQALKERDQKLRRLADHDSLTGLPNRALFNRIVDEAIVSWPDRRASNALLFIDLDQFKYVNDTLGHAAGDRLLIQVAEQFKARLRDQDMLCRFGGDEFTVLVRNVNNKEAVEVARSLILLMQEFTFIEDGQTFNVYCSIGVTAIDSDRFTTGELIAQADMACHEAKTRGRNRFHVYEIEDHDENRMSAEISWSRLIRQVLEQDRFILLFQPIESAVNQNGQREIFEVFLRMPGPNGEVIAPAAFFPAAERFGLMDSIDRWVIKNALSRLAEYRKMGRDILFFINLSGNSFEDEGVDLFVFIQTELERNDLPWSCVAFDITEQVAVRYMDKASRLMRALKKLDCQFVIDDFGAGFSAFGYVKHMPVDFIKIGQPFTTHLVNDPISQAMVRSTIEIAQTLGKHTIAENIEDKATFELLKEYGINYVQGNFLGAPKAEFPALSSTVLPFATKHKLN